MSQSPFRNVPIGWPEVVRAQDSMNSFDQPILTAFDKGAEKSTRHVLLFETYSYEPRKESPGLMKAGLNPSSCQMSTRRVILILTITNNQRCTSKSSRLLSRKKF